MRIDLDELAKKWSQGSQVSIKDLATLIVELRVARKAVDLVCEAALNPDDDGLCRISYSAAIEVRDSYPTWQRLDEHGNQ